MKIIGAIFLLFVFVSSIYAQDLFDQAEIEFDIDYIDISGIEIFGNKKTGQVMAVWMKNGDVLTKTLSKSNAKNSSSDETYPNANYEGPRDYDQGNEVYNYEDDEEIPNKLFVETFDKSDDELIAMANDIINSTTEWTYNFRWSTSYKEEMDLSKILNSLYYKNAKGSKFVNIGIDIISSELEHGVEAVSLLSEKRSLLSFAKGDEELTKQANEFLENNGFNKEKE